MLISYLHLSRNNNTVKKNRGRYKSCLSEEKVENFENSKRTWTWEHNYCIRVMKQRPGCHVHYFTSVAYLMLTNPHSLNYGCLKVQLQLENMLAFNEV